MLPSLRIGSKHPTDFLILILAKSHKWGNDSCPPLWRFILPPPLPRAIVLCEQVRDIHIRIRIRTKNEQLRLWLTFHFYFFIFFLFPLHLRAATLQPSTHLPAVPGFEPPNVHCQVVACLGGAQQKFKLEWQPFTGSFAFGFCVWLTSHHFPPGGSSNYSPELGKLQMASKWLVFGGRVSSSSSWARPSSLFGNSSCFYH